MNLIKKIKILFLSFVLLIGLSDISYAETTVTAEVDFILNRLGTLAA